MLLLTAILTTLASAVLAQGGFRVDVAQVASSVPSTHARVAWYFRLHQTSAVVRWTCSNFSHTADARLVTDASMRAAVASIQGPVQVSPSASIVKTDVSHGIPSASFDMRMQGTGKLDVFVDVEIDVANAAAGDHEATVELTITGL